MFWFLSFNLMFVRFIHDATICSISLLCSILLYLSKLFNPALLLLGSYPTAIPIHVHKDECARIYIACILLCASALRTDIANQSMNPFLQSPGTTLKSFPTKMELGVETCSSPGSGCT